jgi:hypothetical protein
MDRQGIKWKVSEGSAERKTEMYENVCHDDE